MSLNNPSHVTADERLGMRSHAERVSSCGLPRVSTNIEDLQSVLKELMVNFSVVGVSVHYIEYTIISLQKQMCCFNHILGCLSFKWNV